MGTKGIIFGVCLPTATIVGILIFTIFSTDDSSSSQKIQETIQNKISSYPKISEVHTKNICAILGLECTSQKSFAAMYDSSDGYAKFTYSKEHVDYFLRIHNNDLFIIWNSANNSFESVLY